MTVVIDADDAVSLKNWTDYSISENKTIHSLFLQQQQLNCTILTPYITLFQFLFSLYALMSFWFIGYAAAFSHKNTKTMLVFLCNLAVLKVLFSSFNFEYWRRCPWPQHIDSN